MRILLLLFAMIVMSPGEAAVPAAPASQSPTAMQLLEEERAKRQQAEFDKAIAEAKLEVIDAGSSRLENWIGAYGILITVILAVAGFLTWRAAANAARAEIQDVRERIEQLLAKAARDADQIEDTVEAVKGMSEEARRLIHALPGTVSPPSEDVRLEVERLATSAAAKPVAERTGSDLRLLIYEAVQKEDWTATLAFAEELCGMAKASPEEIAYARFYRAYGLTELDRLDEAADAYRDYLELCPDDDIDDRASALSNWGNVLEEKARRRDGADADALWQQAYDKYAEALAIKPDKHEALHNWGTALAEQTRRKEGDELDAMWQAVIEKYTQALAIKPDKHETLSNWGYALDEQAKCKAGAEADALWEQAYDKFAQALAIQPANCEALNCWGCALDEQAQRKHGAEAEALWKQAYEKFEQALAVEPKMCAALNNWGSSLAMHARTKQGVEADGLWDQAQDKFERALAIKPDMREVLNSYASALLVQCRTAEVEKREALWEKIQSLLARGEAIKSGSCSYNFACLYAQQGNVEKASEWLNFGKRNNPRFPNCEHIAGDHDFDAIRDHPMFNSALAAIGCGDRDQRPKTSGIR